MPANLTPQYMEAEQRFKRASTTPEKIAALEDMMAVIPKHKGTEKLQAELRKKMSVLRKEPDQKKSARRDAAFAVDREGARQLTLVGAPNAGKSRLLSALTHATPEVADYPYTTRTPIPGMLIFENIRLQIVDLPAISAEYTESWVFQIIRNSDAVLWIVDLADDDILERFDETRRLLDEAKVDLPPKRTLIVANKADSAGAAERETLLKEYVGADFPVTTFSATASTPEQVEYFKRLVYDFLDVVRVYTKAPGKKPDFEDPYVMPRGSTVIGVAEKVHRDFVERLKYARIWGAGKVDGIMVPRDFVVDEGDVLELHE
jgi:ribosome-interacting GTPase 1